MGGFIIIILFFKLVFALFLIQAPKSTASKYLNQTKSKEVLNRWAVRVPSTPGRNGSSRSTIGHLPRTHRVTAQPNYAKLSAHLPQGLSPGLCRAQAKFLQCWGGSEELPAVQGWLWQHREHSTGTTCSEGLWVSQGGDQGWPDSATTAGGSCWSWGLQYEPWKAGNVASDREHCSLALWERQCLG